MEKKEQLEQAYREYIKNKQGATTKNMRTFLLLVVFTVLPLIGLTGYFMAQDDSTSRTMGYITFLGAVAFFSVDYYKYTIQGPRNFPESKQWENALLEYMEAVGIETRTLSPGYVHHRSYKGPDGDGDGSWNPAILYRGSAKVNGVLQLITVRRDDYTISVYMAKEELLPAI